MSHYLNQRLQPATRLSFRSPLLVLLLMCLVYVMSYFHRVNTSVLAVDIMRDLNLTPEGLGLIGSMTMIGYSITQLPAGMLSDRFGPRRTMAVYQLICGLSCLVFAQSQSLETAAAARLCMGLALAAHVPALMVLADYFSSQSYSKAAGVLLAMSKVGTVLAVGPLAFIAGYIGWRQSLIWAAALTLTLAVLTWFCVRDGIKDPAKQTKKDGQSAVKGLLDIIKRKNFWMVGIWFTAVAGCLFVTMNIWWGPFLMQGIGLSREAAGGILSLMALAPLPLIPVVAVLSDNIFRNRKMFIVISALGTTAVWAVLAFVPDLSIAQITLVGCMQLCFCNPMVPIGYTMIKEIVPPGSLGAAFGLFSAGPPLFAAALQPVFGHILNVRYEIYGEWRPAFSDAFILLLIFMAAATVATLFATDTYQPAAKAEG